MVTSEANVSFWHNARAQLRAFEGAETGRLPTLRPKASSGRSTIGSRP